jgi:mannose-6-phosphate isomerase-like protein (cupin superfamily)
MAGMDPVNIDAMLARFTEHWSPKKITQINDYDVRIVRLQGDFTWHKHDDTDELFLVLSGELTIQMRDRDVILGPRELFVVPQGAEHCPHADTENRSSPAGAQQRHQHRRCWRRAHCRGRNAVLTINLRPRPATRPPASDPAG